MSEVSKKVMQAMLCMTRQCWEQGIAAQALMEAGEEELLALVIHDMVLRQSSDGRLCNVENTPAVTDSAFCVPAVLMTGNKTGSQRYKEAAEENISFFLKDAERAADGTLFHMRHTREIWADSAAFLPYALALSGHFEEAFCQMKGILTRLCNEDTGLYCHIWDDGRRGYLREVSWGIGNGWILTGLLRTLLVWGREYQKEKQQMECWFYALLENMLRFETKNHGFHDILDQPDTFEESECAAMVAYVIYRAVFEGFLEEKYIMRADGIRETLYEKIGSDGLVHRASGSPSFDRPGTSVECQAHVMMMEQAYENVRIS
ncbi:MAG: glycoside hydrolase family 88 protein [Eubacteriales bacterium]|nr:glycoside hydrolase family 88 protein [Eubacteriales bacterium]